MYYTHLSGRVKTKSSAALINTVVKGGLKMPDIESMIKAQRLLFLYLHKSHDTPPLPPKILHNHCFQFLLGHEDVPREI